MESITYLTGIALLLFAGILGSIIAGKVRVSSILVLVLMGMILGNIGLEGFGVFEFPGEFMISLSVLTLAMIVFDGSSRFRLEDLDVQSNRALELVILFIVANILLLGSAMVVLFLDWNLQGVIYALIFSVVMAGTDPASVFILLGETKHQTLDFLKLEAILNTPIIVIIPFVLLKFLQDVSQLTVASTFLSFVAPFIEQVVVGVGTGMIIGIVIFRIMRKYYSEKLSPVALIASTILTYVLAENLQGNGVLAVATLGLLFGNTYVKEKGTLIEFSKLLAMSLEILVFLLIGLLVTLDFSLWFFAKSLMLFGIAVLARYVAVLLTLHNTEFKQREKVFITLNMPKGIAVAVVTLTFYVLDATAMRDVLTLMILFVVYSLVMGSVVDRFAESFIKKSITQEGKTEWTEEVKQSTPSS